MSRNWRPPRRYSRPAQVTPSPIANWLSPERHILGGQGEGHRLDDHSALHSHLPSLRTLPGFPCASDEAILSAALPPAWTPCPNPFIADCVQPLKGLVAATSARFPNDLAEIGRDPVYLAQIYHTKVPPAVIATLIRHHCPPGGIVLDGFCGSGMTGVAARLTGRQAILIDLSPAATAIAASFCLPVPAADVAAAAAQLLTRLRQEVGWLYQTPDAENDYTIWSEVYRCPSCACEAPFSDFAFDFAARHIRASATCPSCHSQCPPAALERSLDDNGRTREVPVRVSAVGRRGDATLADADHALLSHALSLPVPYPHPERYMMDCQPQDRGWGDMWRRGYHAGVWRVADFYTHRTLWCIAAALQFIDEMPCAPEVRHFLRTTVINTSTALTRMHRAYQPPVPLVLYFPRMSRESNVLLTLERRFARSIRALESLPDACPVAISTQSSSALPNIPDGCVDYVFTDPPFGQNIIYSEVNFLWESWLGISTTQDCEAIVSRRQRKSIDDYSGLMQKCFAEFNRVLKPGGWMTVEFHNSRDDVWTAIQHSLQDAGFEIDDVRILDKGHKSFKQASTENAVEKDLVLTCRRPTPNSRRVRPPEPDLWAYADETLCRLRDLDESATADQPAPTRAEQRSLYDAVVQHWLCNGWRVPIDAADFYAGLRQRYGHRAKRP